ncbi:hypothetical protein ALC62_13475 [Cyphomyrmex costatus]|uniref:Uncharacterized protein n=1 Tax=Cyphomyrmex costatus TaxID=456900 RepID=A0A151IA07_9HYME|nr:hypothetical protein ALC62_13475 [Cyphomyrmex costatus]
MSDKDRSSPTLVENSLKSLLDQPSIFPLIGKCVCLRRSSRVIPEFAFTRVYTREIWHAPIPYMRSPRRILRTGSSRAALSSPRSFPLSSNVPRLFVPRRKSSSRSAAFHPGGSAAPDTFRKILPRIVFLFSFAPPPRRLRSA